MNAAADPVVLTGGARTAIGSFGGGLKDVDAADLGAACIREVLLRSRVESEDVDEVVMGQVGQVGADAYNARVAALRAGLPSRSTAMNVNRLCGSGLQAIATGAQALLTDQARVVVAGGNESMSRLPFLDYGGRHGFRLGDRRLVDGVLGLLTDPFGRYPMGVTAENVADKFGVSREDQDRFALRSQERALAAVGRGDFRDEIVEVDPRGRGQLFVEDEHPRATTLDELAALKPVFRDGGTVTAGNACGINDGAAAVVMMRESEARRRRIEPRLVLRSWTVTGLEPEIMGFAPATAIPRAAAKAGVGVDDLDHIELNEAFASQAIAVIRDAGLDDEKVNPLGGAIALGHPVGATGAILTVKLMHALERSGGRLGMVTMCIGGGQGLAAVFERC